MSKKVRVFCPSCRTLLDVPEEFQKTNAGILCPQCHFQAPFNSYGKINSSNGVVNNNSPEEPPTDVIETPKYTSSPKAFLVRKNDKARIFLPRVTTPLGREILNPNDVFISRQHSQIEIRQSGTRVGFVYRDTEAKNPTQINGKAIDKETKVFLNSKDELRIGKTTFVFYVEDKDETQSI